MHSALPCPLGGWTQLEAALSLRLFQPRSTLIEEISGSSLSRGMERRVWPFDLTHGAKTNCR